MKLRHVEAQPLLKLPKRLLVFFSSITVYYSIQPSVNHAALQVERWLGLPQINLRGSLQLELVSSRNT